MFDFDFTDTATDFLDSVLDTVPAIPWSRANVPTFTLGGKSIVLKAIRISPSFELKDKDLSAQSSSSSYAEQGDKSKVLAVTGLIPFNERDQLETLFTLATAKQTKTDTVTVKKGGGITEKYVGAYGHWSTNKSGEKVWVESTRHTVKEAAPTVIKKEIHTRIIRQTYTIGCDIARVLNIRKVRFSGRIVATEQENIRAWKISFTLVEVDSPSEATERQLLASMMDQAKEGVINQLPDGLINSVNTAQQQITDNILALPQGLIESVTGKSQGDLAALLQNQIWERLK
ncbi:hypothetical protein AYY19_04120 [Photobacterium aquimaris]|uniref:baseplate complex protein n=1 Tax=Photobacterium aquimaris TaxID=512643 RepID=UPI0007EF0982|nr:hypothetical protein [Photobacterium aquimaris]OBU16352.1 hypothetical protein AYY19_04120 [Photobacterium aquimaris]PSW02242.1 hypothetical protein CTM91_03950 [Photobacterium aquimaris]